MQFLKLQIHFGGDIHEVNALATFVFIYLLINFLIFVQIIVPSNEDPLVRDFQAEIERQFFVPVQVQRLVFKGQSLHEKPNFSLRAFGITNSSLIRLVGRKGVLSGDDDEGQ